MSRSRASLGILPDDLYIPIEPWPRIGRPAKHDVSAWTGTDDWPDRVPITDAELEVFERWFGDLFDELFGLMDRHLGDLKSALKSALQ